ncbi:hypothetical protein, partial [Mycolicibacterium conceptionense]|uniref:hypothetical protein n=1 Tax=Mycolicibacterium conceptionense TaxID=451644 RepID=UPI001A962DC8
PPTPHRHRRNDTNRAPTRSQPTREEQLVLVLAVAGAGVTALAIHDLQSWLERWAYERHAQD